MVTNDNGSGQGGLDFDLNLAPIIDCFTVLITFLLASASFLSIGLLDAGIAAGGEKVNDNVAAPPIQIELLLTDNGQTVIEITGKLNEKTPVAALNENSRDLHAIESKLQALKSRWPEAQALTISASPQVPYKDVIVAMELARKTHPAVLLGGF